jgi:ATP-binding protein involved in chromosome partitioning
MISKELIKSCIEKFAAHISEIIVHKNSLASFSVYDDDGLDNAQKIKREIESLLQISFPEAKILISITNRNHNFADNKQLKSNLPQGNLPGVSKVILVSSCKGGVGKSTISAALASYLCAKNKKVGLLDADIYGPSIPEIVGLKSFSPKIEKNKMIPPIVQGVKIISIGFLASNDGAFVWRGPMLTKAITQLFAGVDWGDLDYLIVDTPPGTGDIHISILSNYQISGAIIVTMPSQISANDVARCIDLYHKFNTNIYGIVENMSYYQEKDRKIAIFGQGGGSMLSERFNLPLIAKTKIVQGLERVNFLQLHKALDIDFVNL